MRGLGDGVGLAVVPVGGGGAWPGFVTTRRAAEQRPGPTGVEGAGGTGGPGRGAGGWRQGQGGPRDRSLRAAGSRVAISRAGRRPPAHTAARPTEAGPAARTASGRAAAHRHTQRPDRTRQIMRSGRRAHTAARPNKTEDPATGSLATRAASEQCTGCTAIKTAEAQRKQPTQTPAFTASQQHSQKSYEKYASFIGSS